MVAILRLRSGLGNCVEKVHFELKRCWFFGQTVEAAGQRIPRNHTTGSATRGRLFRLHQSLVNARESAEKCSHKSQGSSSHETFRITYKLDD